MTTYTVYDSQNRAIETFNGPCRLAKWASLPEGWTIEEFWGATSRGCVSLTDVLTHCEAIRPRTQAELLGR